MSSIAATKNTRNRYSDTRTKTKTGGGKLCQFCKDLGKTRDEYTSHYVRESPNPNSKVVCPTLKAMVCRYCKDSGHTVKHCPKIDTKNNQQTRAQESHIVSKNYCLPVNTKKTSNVNNLHVSAFSVLGEDSSDEEEEEDVVITTPPPRPPPQSPPRNERPVSYAGVLQNMPNHNKALSSQVESLIPVKLNFSGDNVVTLDKVTMRWADEEDLDECDILYMRNVPPPPFASNQPLTRFVSFVDALARDYTCGLSKSIAITSDAFQQLSKNWETDFFNIYGYRNALDESQSTNARARYIIMTNRYTQ